MVLMEEGGVESFSGGNSVGYRIRRTGNDIYQVFFGQSFSSNWIFSILS